MATQGRSEIRPDGARENLREKPARLQRRRGLTTDKFYVPEELKKPGWSYEFKRLSVMGQPEREHQVELAQNHWQPVAAKDMPGMMPEGWEGAVERGGQVLMMRPDYLTQEAEQETLDVSGERMRANEKRLGLADQGQAPRTRPSISREYLPPQQGEHGDRRSIPD